jgi:hypothetical protein
MYRKEIMCDGVVWIQMDQHLVRVARSGEYRNKTSGHIRGAKIFGQHFEMDSAPARQQSHFLH